MDGAEVHRSAYSKQVTDKAAIEKMQFGGFYDLLAYIGMPGRRPENQKTCFQDTQPCLCGIVV
jgi:hypothetical protein